MQSTSRGCIPAGPGWTEATWQGCAPCPPRPFRPGWGTVPPAHPLPSRGGGLHTLPASPPGWGVCAPCPSAPSTPGGSLCARLGPLSQLGSAALTLATFPALPPGGLAGFAMMTTQRELGSSSEGGGSKASVASRVWVRGLGPPARQQRWSEEDRPGPTLPSVSGDGRQHEARAKAGSPGQRWEERRAPLARLRTSEGRAGFWQNLPCGRTHGRAHRGSRCGWGACSRSRHSAGLSPPARAQRGGSWTPGPG